MTIYNCDKRVKTFTCVQWTGYNDVEIEEFTGGGIITDVSAGVVWVIKDDRKWQLDVDDWLVKTDHQDEIKKFSDSAFDSVFEIDWVNVPYED